MRGRAKKTKQKTQDSAIQSGPLLPDNAFRLDRAKARLRRARLPLHLDPCRVMANHCGGTRRTSLSQPLPATPTTPSHSHRSNSTESCHHPLPATPTSHFRTSRPPFPLIKSESLFVGATWRICFSLINWRWWLGRCRDF